jgi:hypothetical protein
LGLSRSESEAIGPLSRLPVLCYATLRGKRYRLRRDWPEAMTILWQKAASI